MSTTKRGFLLRDVAKYSGIEKGTIRYWARTHFITPSVQEADGRGSRREYSFRDIVELRVAKRLRDAGISLQGLRKVVDRLREVEDLEAPFAERYLLTDGNDVFVKDGDDEVMSILKQPGQYAMTVLPLSRTVEEVRDAVKEKRGVA